MARHMNWRLSVCESGTIWMTSAVISCISVAALCGQAKLGGDGAPMTGMHSGGPAAPHDVAIQDYLLVAAKGCDVGDPESLAKFVQTARILGELRTAEAPPALAPYMELSTLGPIGTRIPRFSDYPVAVALAKIDLPSIDAVLREFIKGNHRTTVPSLILTAMMPTEPAIGSIDAFEQQQGRNMNGEQRQRLEQLRKAVRVLVHNGRPPLPPPNKDLAKHALLVQRAEMIEKNLKLLKGERDWNQLSPEAREAVATLGELRAAEAAELFSQQLLTKSSAAGNNEHGSAKDLSPSTTKASNDALLTGYPVAAALAKIGLPSVAPLLKRVTSGDQEDVSRDVAGATLRRMMPSVVAVVFVDEAIGQEKNELARARLKKLRDRLLDDKDLESSR